MIKRFIIFSSLILSNLNLVKSYNLPATPISLDNHIKETAYLISTKDIDVNDLGQKVCHHKNLIIDNICQSPDNGIKVIKFIAGSLPKLDSIAPKILHMNDMIIDFALNNNFLPIEVQKKLVLLSINFAINGDEIGSKFLKFFYDLVENCL